MAFFLFVFKRSIQAGLPSVFGRRDAGRLLKEGQKMLLICVTHSLHNLYHWKPGGGQQLAASLDSFAPDVFVKGTAGILLEQATEVTFAQMSCSSKTLRG